MTNRLTTLEDVLDALMYEESAPTHDTLMRWIQQYPEYRDALIKFFVTWAIQSDGLDEPVVDERSLATRTVSYALNAIHALHEASEKQPDSLFDIAHRARVAPETLAAQTMLDDSIITKLSRRLITDVPQHCVDLLSIALSLGRERIFTMVTGPPLHAARARFKARKKPSPVTEDFLTAVERSTLSPETQKFWATVVAREREAGK